MWSHACNTAKAPSVSPPISTAQHDATVCMHARKFRLRRRRWQKRRGGKRGKERVHVISESLYALHSVTVSSRPVQVSDGSTTGSSPDRRRAYNSIKDIINGIISDVVNGIDMHEAAVDRLNGGLTGLTERRSQAEYQVCMQAPISIRQARAPSRAFPPPWPMRGGSRGRAWGQGMHVPRRSQGGCRGRTPGPDTLAGHPMVQRMHADAAAPLGSTWSTMAATASALTTTRFRSRSSIRAITSYLGRGSGAQHRMANKYST